MTEYPSHLFPVVAPSDVHRGINESLLDYLARRPEPKFALVRAEMEAWLALFPEDRRDGIRRDLASKDDRTFRSACWELVLHAALVRAGCTVSLHVDPGTGTTKRPDFYVVPPDGSGEFIMEARVTHDEDEGVVKSLRELKERVERVRSDVPTGYHLRVLFRGAPSRQIPVGQVERALRVWLERSLSGAETAPFQRVIEDDEDAPFGTFSLRCELDQAPGISEVKMPGDVDVVRAIRRATAQKSTRYGSPTLPYVVALNVVSGFGVYPHEVPEALYGRPQSSDRGPLEERNDGLWSGGMHTRVSGVFVLPGALPLEVGTDSGALYLNPRPQYLAPPFLRELTTWSMGPDGLTCHPGKTLADCLELPPGWPDTER